MPSVVEFIFTLHRNIEYSSRTCTYYRVYEMLLFLSLSLSLSLSFSLSLSLSLSIHVLVSLTFISLSSLISHSTLIYMYLHSVAAQHNALYYSKLEQSRLVSYFQADYSLLSPGSGMVLSAVDEIFCS